MRSCLMLALACGLAAGCSRDPHAVGKTVPVAGRVLVDGKVFTGKARVTFWPDATKGNTSEHRPSADIDGDGQFALSTADTEGAAPGWYKVTVRVIGETQGPLPNESPLARYGMPMTSGLAVEVTEAAPPGAYDVQLARKGPAGTRVSAR
jgi:hypothetical protein